MSVESCDYACLSCLTNKKSKKNYGFVFSARKLVLLPFLTLTHFASASESTVTIPNTAINDEQIVVDNNYIVDLSTPFSDEGSFGYYYKSGERNFPGKVASIAVGDFVSNIEFQSNEFGSIFNYIADDGAVFHTGLDLYPNALKGAGTNTDEVRSIVKGRVVHNGLRNSAGYYSMVLSKLSYRVKVPRFNYQYTSWITDRNGSDDQRTIASLNDYTVNQQPVEVSYFVSNYLHLDSAQRATSNNTLQSGNRVGQLFNDNNTDTVEDRTYSSPPHLHFEILLPKQQSGSYSVGFFNGYDLYSQVVGTNGSNGRINQDFGYVDPQQFIAQIQRRNKLLKNLARADLHCTDNDTCHIPNGNSIAVNSHVDRNHMAIAQHYLGHDQSLIFSQIPNVVIETKDTCSAEGQLCQYVKYTYNGKTYIVSKNLQVVHTQLAAHWHLNKDGLPTNPAYEDNNVVRQKFQYGLTAINGGNLIRTSQSVINIEPRVSSDIKTEQTTIANVDYWVTNDSANMLYFDIGQYGSDFVSIETVELHVPYETKKINVDGKSVFPANNDVSIALYRRHKDQINGSFTIVSQVTFTCLDGEFCQTNKYSAANGLIEFNQQNGALNGDGIAKFSLSTTFEENYVYALGFNASAYSNINGVAASRFKVALNTNVECTNTNASFMHKMVQFISMKKIGSCNAQ